jgi:hypothetical protein
MAAISYKAPPTLARFMRSDAFMRVAVGPVGSGKSSACVMEIIRRAREQADFSRDGQRALRQRSEQKRTLSQSFAHFLRHAKGFWHAAHIFDGKSPFLTILGMLQSI